MKKYTPSVKNNNQIKEEIMQELQSFLYRVEKGKYNSSMDKETVRDVYESMNEAFDSLSGTIFTGDEDLSQVYAKIEDNIVFVKKALEQDYANRLVDAVDNLLYYLDSFRAIGDGDISYIDEQDEKAQKLSWSKRRLYARLDELNSIKNNFQEQEKRLENEIKGLEKDLSELDEKMLNEDNERLINDLYRKISALKSKLDMLYVRRSNYSACFNILDIIYANSNEILAASQFDIEEASKAKALLNIGKLKAVVNEPDKAIAILKVMDKDIKAISEKVKGIDAKVFDLDTKHTSVNNNALAYKEELMRKKREREFNNENLSELERGEKPVVNTVKEDK